ncbi:MAG: 3-dehydroquinate synthase family protein, partial [Planctomycetota bacterium]
HDPAVAAPFPEKVRERLAGSGAAPAILAIEGGESAKGIDHWRALLDAFDDAGLDRGSDVIALGGGAVGDVTGFAAACWHRGTPWIGIPTTLLGMVDALIGGKTAINHRRGKNLVGAFHLPREVHVDPAALAGLPAREMRPGWGEVLKSAMIGDAHLFRLFEEAKRGPGHQGEPSADTILRSIRVKVAVVEEDFREQGRRMVLNLGHSLAHALEADPEHAPLAHGEAVAVGLIFVSRLAADLGIAAAQLPRRVEAALATMGLPRRWDVGRAEMLLSLIERDKKNRGGHLRLTLPLEIGHVEVAEVPREAILHRLRAGPGDSR